MPRVGIAFYYNKDGAGWRLQTSGLGPTLFRTFEVFVDRIPQPNWKTTMNALRLQQDVFEFEHTTVRAEVLLKPDVSSKILWVANEQVAHALKREQSRVEIVCCYCSLYDECWRTTNRKGRELEKVRKCKPLSNVEFDSPPIESTN